MDEKTMTTTPLSAFPAAGPLGRLGRARRQGVAATGRKALRAGAHHLLQLRIGVRAARLRRQGHQGDPQARGQPAPPRFARPQLRQGPRDPQPDPRPRPHPLSHEAGGPRGSGKFERTTWDEVLDTFAARIRKAIQEDRKTEVMYHVGRPGADGYMDRVLQSWGVDGHNSHTNVCSAAARLGYTLWSGHDRPSPDYANAKFILLISAHLETGHYFNPHAQRIIEAKMEGAKIATCDIRLSNTASMADYWLRRGRAPSPRCCLGFAHVILRGDLYDRGVPRAVGRLAGLPAGRSGRGPDGRLRRVPRGASRRSTQSTPPSTVAEICGLPAEQIEAGRPGDRRRRWPLRRARLAQRRRPATRAAGRSPAACSFLSVLTGAVGSCRRHQPRRHQQVRPPPFAKPAAGGLERTALPREWPLSHHELSSCCPTC